jgi:hypothetical protein
LQLIRFNLLITLLCELCATPAFSAVKFLTAKGSKVFAEIANIKILLINKHTVNYEDKAPGFNNHAVVRRIPWF